MSKASWIAFLVSAPSVFLSAAEPNFEHEVAPLLARRCLECHSSEEKKGGLDLTNAKSAANGGETGAAIVPEKPDDSLLWQRVAADEMPPKAKLSAEEKSTLRAWLAAGAKFDRPIDPLRFSSERRAGYDWWALQPVKRPPLPVVKRTDWPRNAIDFFVLKQLEERSLSPSAEADRTTLWRRLSFDLLGLPGECESSFESVEQLVDHLLASPHYGERWARHWLDVAHFGESDGFEYDRLRPNAWPFRDWVVQAFNTDLPYDEFARMQIAGEILRPGQRDGIVATGFLVGGAFDGLMPSGDLMRQIMRQDELEDLVGVLGQTFLGLTTQCARCHSHKFDPIPQTDYFRLASALAGVKRGDRAIPTPDAGPLQERIANWSRELASLEEAGRKAVLNRRRKTDSEPNGVGTAKTPTPAPIAAWDFSRSSDDLVGELKGTLHGGAKRDQGRLVLNGSDAYLASAPLKQELKAKTLEAVVTLGNLTQRGGGVIGVQSLDGVTFDAIVFGERDPGQWMAGSNFFARTQSFGGAAETLADQRPAHVAIVYEADGTIRGYVNGQLYGKPYASKLQPFEPGKTQVVLGMRHGPPGGNRLLTGAIHRAALFDRALSPEEIAVVASRGTDFVSESELTAELSPADRDRRQVLKSQIASHQDQLARSQSGKVYAITPQSAPVTRVLARGNPGQPLDPVSPGGLSALVGLPGDFQLPPDAADADRRRELAKWITEPRNALFTRTIVNRLWHYHFGTGLVSTPNDLGFSGGQPTNGPLLDCLAAELVESGFSLKHLQRLIVTSAVYRQSSAANPSASRVDADNRYLWRKTPLRLEAEAVRDAMLAVAGELNTQMGGPGYQDFRPFLRGGTQFYEPLDPVGPAFQRRSLYRTWARGGHNHLLDTFDCPDPSTTTPRRSVTTTPLQALSLLNNSFVLRMAERFADRLRREAGPAPESRIELAFRLAQGREATAEEVRATKQFVESQGLEEFCRVLFNTNAFVYVP